MQLPTYRKLVRASALYDILVTAPLATPWTLAPLHALMSRLNVQLGGAPLPAFEPFHMFIAGLLGSVVVVWSLLRLRHPSRRLSLYDGAARFLFSGWMAWTLAQTGAPLLWLLLVPEFAWGIAQWWPLAGEAVPHAHEKRPLRRTGSGLV